MRPAAFRFEPDPERLVRSRCADCGCPSQGRWYCYECQGERDEAVHEDARDAARDEQRIHGDDR